MADVVEGSHALATGEHRLGFQRHWRNYRLPSDQSPVLFENIMTGGELYGFICVYLIGGHTPGRKTYLEAVIVGLLKKQIEALMRGTHNLEPTVALNEERK